MDWEPLIRVGFAALLSLPIGLERELRGKPAGLRTHVVVATACAAFGYLSVITAEGIAGADRTRIASTVVTGVGFIGAGVTFAAGGKVHGLTTAAAIFSAAAVGLTVGMGHTELGAALVAVTVLFLWPVERLTSGWLAARRVDERIFHFVARDIAVIA
ncbi:MAG TPA: MgtC/SapB family protein, partial [Egibacteraceae bacterium]|nr:MgtC/SapB family protein [Egibacteraceae bacterium]